ncbi:MAG TPA: hypothetical protein VLA61_14295 [Ideonella sp.]|uniref:hypothetical protein n=1 Tax=Ideonella sp. TaxID=1929293 RepID=UPI002BDE19D6|nr:hypothetical protein [Ideonella sp.]HSI49441.1 hypothetical protein [Ideonella sp.]
MLPAPHAVEEDEPEERTAAFRPGLRSRLLLVLWPAFVTAGVLAGLVFAWIDPGSVLGLAVGEETGWSRSAVCSLAFLVFWATTSASAAITLWLVRGTRPRDRD